MSSTAVPRILFLGGGNMAAAMIGGLVAPARAAGQGAARPQLSVVEPDEAARTGLERRFAVETRQRVDPAARIDAVVLAVKPQVAAEALQQARPVLAANAGAVLVSIAAGTTIAALRAASGHGPIVRAMPNTPALIGEGVTGLFVPADVPPERVRLAEQIVASTGSVVRLDRESDLDAVTAVSGSGPAYVFYLIEAMIQAARAEGLDEQQARRLVLGTVRGAALLAEASDEPAAVLRQRVTSPNGTTAAAIAELDRRQVMEAIVAAIASARRRSEALGRG